MRNVHRANRCGGCAVSTLSCSFPKLYQANIVSRINFYCWVKFIILHGTSHLIVSNLIFPLHLILCFTLSWTFQWLTYLIDDALISLQLPPRCATPPRLPQAHSTLDKSWTSLAAWHITTTFIIILLHHQVKFGIKLFIAVSWQIIHHVSSTGLPKSFYQEWLWKGRPPLFTLCNGLAVFLQLLCHTDHIRWWKKPSKQPTEVFLQQGQFHFPKLCRNLLT